MGGLSWWHWVIIIAAFILIFGARKLPDAARGVGRSLRILKSEVSAMHDDDEKANRPPAETDATATVATPPSQIAAAPVVATPQTSTPQTAPAAQTAPPAAQAPQSPAPPQQAQVPVINGVPVTDQQRT